MNSTDGRDANPRVWSSDGGTDFFGYTWWNRLFLDPDFFQMYIDRYQELRGLQFSTPSLWRLTDDLANPAQFVIPSGYVIPPGGYLLVWADNEPGQQDPARADLHVNFRLNNTGESLGVFASDGTLSDSQDYAITVADVNEVVGLKPTDIRFALSTASLSAATDSGSKLNAGALMGALTAVDSDSSQWTFSLSGLDSSRFALSSSTLTGSVNL